MSLRYRFLAGLPEPLRHPTIVNLHGELWDRGPTIALLYRSLLNGHTPPLEELTWPEQPFRTGFYRALRNSGAFEACRADPDFTCEVLLYLLNEVEVAERFYERALLAYVHAKPEKSTPEDREPNPAEFAQDKETLALELACEGMGVRLEGWFSDHVGLRKDLADALQQLTATVGLPPGTARGLLRSLPRGNLLLLRRLLATINKVNELIVQLGRGQEGEGGAPVFERVATTVEREVWQPRVIHGPEATQVRGVERSGEIARMLPSEAALLSHPTLRMLWHARRAERTLLTYHARGVWTESVLATQTFDDGEVVQHPRAEQGPVIVVLDTSGSMKGVPEELAKAVVLQLLARCVAEKRPCYVYNFSGPGNLHEHELGFDDEGMASVLRFLSMSFHGGTCPEEALRRACARLKEETWRQADLVVLSDGHFDGAPSRRLIEEARKVCNMKLIGVRAAQEPPAADMQIRELEELLASPEAKDASQEELDYAHQFLAQLRQGSRDGLEQLGCDEIRSLAGWLDPDALN
ncbi:MAG: VWA domain-containing protein [Myxococcota bacterium]